MIVLYLAVAGSCAEDKANAGGGSGAGGVPTVSITNFANLGPTTGTGPLIGVGNTVNSVQMIPPPHFFIHPADCLQLDINFAANGATITQVVLQAIHTASGQALTIELASAVQGIGAPLGDGFAYMSNNDSLTMGGGPGVGASATDVVLITPTDIDVVASNAAATVQNTFYFILIRQSAFFGQGGSPAVNLTTGDQVDFIVTVVPATGLPVQATASAIMA